MRTDDDLLNLADYERAAEQVLAESDHAYVAGGVADGWSVAENRRAFQRWALRPRVLRDVSHVSTVAQVGDKAATMPVLLAPTAMHRLAHAEGEVATARGARRAGVTQVLSTMSSRALEDVAATGVDLWFQLYVFPNRAATERLVQRAEAAGCQALVLTVDVPVFGLRENLVRAGFDPELPLPNLEQDVAGLLDGVRGFDPSLTWKDVEWLSSCTQLPVWIKGVLRADDARLAYDHGVAGLIVSNHGGRQLDGAIAPLDALPEIVEAVGDRLEILVDGGVRRGTDVLKALALGARAVLLGRPQFYGLAVGGEAGVARVLELLRLELENVMAQCGCSSLEEVTPDLLHRL